MEQKLILSPLPISFKEEQSHNPINFEKSPRAPDGSLDFLRAVKMDLDSYLSYRLSNALDFKWNEIHR